MDGPGWLQHVGVGDVLTLLLMKTIDCKSPHLQLLRLNIGPHLRDHIVQDRVLFGKLSRSKNCGLPVGF